MRAASGTRHVRASARFDTVSLLQAGWAEEVQT